MSRTARSTSATSSAAPDRPRWPTWPTRPPACRRACNSARATWSNAATGAPSSRCAALERDAWVDALTDTTWNLGGTNYQGYSLGGNYTFDRHATIGVRWTSTRNLDDGRRFLANPSDPTSVTGNLSSAPLKIDVIQVEVNAKF